MGNNYWIWVTVDTEDISLRLCLVIGRQRPEQINADAQEIVNTIFFQLKNTVSQFV